MTKPALNPIQSAVRTELVEILKSLVPPPNFKVTLDVDFETENLTLLVLKRDPKRYKIMGKTFWTSNPQWAIQRRLTSRTYAGLLTQLKERPEFLEFELAYEGSIEYQTV